MGCTTIHYGDAPLAASIDTAAETDCYIIAGANLDQAQTKAIRSTGTFDTTTEVIRPAGTTKCGATTADTTTCTLDVTGNHVILIRDNTGTLTGNYTIELDKL